MRVDVLIVITQLNNNYKASFFIILYYINTYHILNIIIKYNHITNVTNTHIIIVIIPL